jgi:hypothetical protein
LLFNEYYQAELVDRPGGHRKPLLPLSLVPLLGPSLPLPIWPAGSPGNCRPLSQCLGILTSLGGQPPGGHSCCQLPQLLHLALSVH